MNLIRGKYWGLYLSLLSIMMLASCSINKQKITSIEIWHHYEGAQKIAFDELIMKFNETEGMNKGIVVEAFGQGSINHLEVKLMESINNKKSASDRPHIFTTHTELANNIDRIGMLVNIEKYMKKSEINNHVGESMKRGYIGNQTEFKIFPIAKSTDVMILNKTDWDKFAKATGAKLDDLQTWEGLAKVAERYYNWTNSLTSERDGGKAFFAMDNMLNYMMLGSQQLGQPIFEVHNNQAEIRVNNDIMRKLWDYYYIPHVNGYYGPFEKYCSDDMKVGNIITYVGAADEIKYFPKRVTKENGISYDIEPLILPMPHFAGSEPCVSLQYTGMSILKSDEQHERAAIEFLKWFTSASTNMEFSLRTGYLPINPALDDMEFFMNKIKYADRAIASKQVNSTLELIARQIQEYDVCANEDFNKSVAARDVLASSLINRAKGDRDKVFGLMESGMDRKTAVNMIATESNFGQWVVRFKMEVGGVLK